MISDVPVVVYADAASHEVHVFLRSANGRVLDFESHDGQLRDK